MRNLNESSEPAPKLRAFISYRHCPLDIAVAKDVQRRLEHYRIPGAVRKMTGVRKIGRIFRDDNELPVTYDIGEDIRRALTGAEYLIVICSTHTAESAWVGREIRLFLEHHDRNHVVTVLADGQNPGDVIPDILLSDEEGRAVEPLSCDLRTQKAKVGLLGADEVLLPSSSVRSRETTRLAAALLGCSFDDLMQREQQYRIRRRTAQMSAVVGVLLCFLAVVTGGSRRVNESYHSMLKSRSRYLAQASETALGNGKNILARLLALAAVPDEWKEADPAAAALEGHASEPDPASGLYDLGPGERYPELYRALYDSTGAGQYPFVRTPPGYTQTAETVRVCMDGNVAFAKAYPEEDRLLVFDNMGVMALASISTGELISRSSHPIRTGGSLIDEMANKVLDYGSGAVLVLGHGESSGQLLIEEISLADGQTVRTLEIPGSADRHPALAVMPQSDENESPDFLVSEAEPDAIGLNRQLRFVRIDGKTWKEVQSWPDQDDSQDDAGNADASGEETESAFAAAARQIAAIGDTSAVTAEDSWRLNLSYGIVTADGRYACFVDADMLAVAVWDLEKNRVSFYDTPKNEDGIDTATAEGVLAPGTGHLICAENFYGSGIDDKELFSMDPSDGSIDWTCSVNDGEYGSSYAGLKLSDGESGSYEYVLAAVGKYLFRLSPDSGVMWNHYTFGQKILSIGDADDEVADVCLADGTDIIHPREEYSFSYDQDVVIGEVAHEGGLTAFSHLEEKPWLAAGTYSRFGTGRYLRVEGKTASICERAFGDEGYAKADGPSEATAALPEDYYIDASRQTDSRILLLLRNGSTDEDGEVLACLDAKTLTFLWSCALPEGGIWELQSVSGDGAFGFLDDGTTLYDVSIGDGTLTPLTGLEDGEGEAFADCWGCSFCGDLMISPSLNEVTVWDIGRIAAGEADSLKGTAVFAGDDVGSLSFIGADRSRDLLYFCDDSTGLLWVLDLQKKEERDFGEIQLTEPWNSAHISLAADESAGLCAVWAGNEGPLFVIDEDSGQNITIQADGVTIAGCSFYGGELILFSGQNGGFRYDPSDGHLLGRFETGILDETLRGQADAYDLGDGVALFDLKDSLLESCCLLIDTEEWTVMTSPEGMRAACFSAPARRLLDSPGLSGVFSYPVYPLSGLIRKAEDLTEKDSLTQEECLKYGLTLGTDSGTALAG